MNASQAIKTEEIEAFVSGVLARPVGAMAPAPRAKRSLPLADAMTWAVRDEAGLGAFRGADNFGPAPIRSALGGVISCNEGTDEEFGMLLSGGKATSLRVHPDAEYLLTLATAPESEGGAGLTMAEVAALIRISGSGIKPRGAADWHDILQIDYEGDEPPAMNDMTRAVAAVYDGSRNIVGEKLAFEWADFREVMAGERRDYRLWYGGLFKIFEACLAGDYEFKTLRLTAIGAEPLAPLGLVMANVRKDLQSAAAWPDGRIRGTIPKPKRKLSKIARRGKT